LIAAVALRWSSSVAVFDHSGGTPVVLIGGGGVLQLIEMKGSEMGPKEEGGEGRSLELTERDGGGGASHGIR
jgi:hypothetical protein